MGALIEKEIYQFRVHDEMQIVELIEKHKAESRGLVTYKTVYKTKKSDGEIVDSWYIVTITHDYTV